MLLTLHLASAGPLEPKRSREPLPALSVERGPVLPMGWFEVGVTHTSGGDVHRQDLALRYGLSRQVEVFGQVPIHEARGSVAIGDTSLGLRLEVSSTDLPTRSLALEAGLSGSSGPNSPWVGDGPRFSAGAPGAWAAVGCRQQVGAMAVDLGLRAAHWFEGLRPSSLQAEARGGLVLQGGPLVVRAAGLLVSRRDLDVRLDTGVEVHVSRGLEVGLVGDFLLDGGGSARLPSQGQEAARLGAVFRVHF